MRQCPRCGQVLPDDARFCFRDGIQLNVPPSSSQDNESPSIDQRIDRSIGGRYHIIAQLGEGGMGTVYLARHQTLAKLVAIKFLHEDQASQADMVSRFLVEAKSAARLDHPNIVSIYDFGRDRSGGYFLVMEYVEGEGLHELIVKTGPLDQLRTINILFQIVAAVSAAHQANILHRDLKPENVIITQSRAGRDQVKILDFGLAKILGEPLTGSPLTMRGQFIGTPAYVAPERIRSGQVDGRCDLYSIGVMAYELLSGFPPFSGDHLTVLRAQMLTMPPRIQEAYKNIEVHPLFEDLIMNLMAKKPGDRPSKAEDVLRILSRIERKLTAELSLTTPEDPTFASVSASLMLGTPIFGSPAPARRHSTPVIDLSEQFSTTLEIQTERILWESSELLLEMRRLSGIWKRRVTELARLVWSRNERSKVDQALQEIRRLEAGIGERETEIAVFHADLESLEQKQKDDEGSFRMHRLELVSQIETLKGALGDDNWSQLVQLNGDVLEDENTQDTIEILPGYTDLDGMKEAFVSADREIQQVDQKTRLIQRERELEQMRLEQGIHEGLLEVRDLQRELNPLYTNLASKVSQAAEGRPDLTEQLDALKKVAQAIEYSQAVLGTLH